MEQISASFMTARCFFVKRRFCFCKLYVKIKVTKMKHKHRELNETMVREAKVLISSRNKITYTLEIKQVKNIN